MTQLEHEGEIENPLSCQHVSMFISNEEPETHIRCQTSIPNSSTVNK